MDTEIWKDIPDHPNYQVSNAGRVRNKKTGNMMTLKPGRDGRYLSVYLCDDGKENTYRVHRLVAETFLGKHPDLVVNHKDGDRLNNHMDNLEWCTITENNRHAIKNGLNHPGAYQKRPVRIVETGEIFDGVVACAEAIGADFRNVHRSLKHDAHYAVNGLHFEYADDVKPESPPFLATHQVDAVERMFDGCILNGGVGSGKSRTALYYYFKEHGGKIENQNYTPMVNPCDLYIITTAKKRDDLEWEGEMTYFQLTRHPEAKRYNHNIMVDSWQNIKKYVDVQNAFFIFDEDHVTGSGAWVQAFYKIAKKNRWIILSASPGDKWEEYIPVFVANGFYRNKTEFSREHLVYARYSKYPKVERYLNTGRLIRLRNKILIDMDFKRHTIPHHEDIYVKYDVSAYKDIGKLRWNPYKNEPIINASDLCYVWRKIVNSDASRQVALLELFEDHPRMIIFYNFTYELEILKQLFEPYENVQVAEWNGRKHEPIPDSDSWVYLVQYTAGCEGFNCIKTDTIVFYSQNYSYKVMIQAAGRIDRLNTPYTDLYYYHLKSRSGIDLAISRALKEKKNFNEGRYVERSFDRFAS